MSGKTAMTPRDLREMAAECSTKDSHIRARTGDAEVTKEISLVEKLRQCALACSPGYTSDVCTEAVNELKRLNHELRDHMWWERTALELQRQRDAFSVEIEWLRKALQMIANQTVCPELFPDDDPQSDSCQIKTALTIATAALEWTPASALSAEGKHP
jgi:hypothetical protein